MVEAPEIVPVRPSAAHVEALGGDAARLVEALERDLERDLDPRSPFEWARAQAEEREREEEQGREGEGAAVDASRENQVSLTGTHPPYAAMGAKTSGAQKSSNPAPDVAPPLVEAAPPRHERERGVLRQDAAPPREQPAPPALGAGPILHRSCMQCGENVSAPAVDLYALQLAHRAVCRFATRFAETPEAMQWRRP